MSAKLSDDDVRAIRASEESGTTLAAQFGVSQATISRIKRRLARPEVEDAAMTDPNEPAVEGGVIVPKPPDPEPMATELSEGERNVLGLSAQPVHLGDGRLLERDDIVTVTNELAGALEAKGLARIV